MSSSLIIVDCLLPNNVIVLLSCHRHITLGQLKEKLWHEAVKYPGYESLRAPQHYLLAGVTQDAATTEEFWDQGRRLCDLRLCSPLLKVVEVRGPMEQEHLNNEISQAIGRSVHDLDNSKDEELQDFRRNIMEVVREGMRARQARGLASLSSNQHPAELEPSPDLPTSIDKRLDQGYLMVTVWRSSCESVTVRATWDTYPDGIIAAALKRFSPPLSNHPSSPRKARSPQKQRKTLTPSKRPCTPTSESLTLSKRYHSAPSEIPSSTYTSDPEAKTIPSFKRSHTPSSEPLRASKRFHAPLSDTPSSANTNAPLSSTLSDTPSYESTPSSKYTNTPFSTLVSSSIDSDTPYTSVTHSKQNHMPLSESQNLSTRQRTTFYDSCDPCADKPLTKLAPSTPKKSQLSSDSPSHCRNSPLPTKLSNSDSAPPSDSKTHKLPVDQQKYALKVCGTNEYLLAVRPITQYKTVRLWLSRGKTPQLSLVSRGELYASLAPPSSGSTPTPLPCPPIPPQGSYSPPPSPPISLWHPSMDGRLKVHILRGSNLGTKSSQKLYVQVGVYHGSESLCCVRETERSSGKKGDTEWGEWSQLDLPIQEIPRAAKLCLVLCLDRHHDNKRKKDKVEDVQLWWGSVPLFDHRGRLVHGRVKVPLTTPPPPPPNTSQRLINPPRLAGQPWSSEAATLEVGFERRFNQNVTFPDAKQMEDYARYIIKLDARTSSQDNGSITEDLSTITTLAEKDALYKISSEDCQLLWRRRVECLSLPHSLPKLLEAVKWSSRDHVSQLYLLVKSWSCVSPSVALELLQSRYPDPTVRAHAVASLERIPDEALSQYLLQLVPSLKEEVVLDSPLLRLLLRRALAIPSIAHTVFWLLRSEAHTWSSVERPLSILEALCRGLGLGWVQRVARQAAALNTLARVAQEVKDTTKDKTQYLQDQLRESETLATLQHLASPLTPGATLGSLKVSECRVLDSARRPLRLVWTNPEPMAPLYSLTHPIIFKSGEDLRQDMLTLQVIGTLAQLWNSEGLDLRMTPYGCLAMDREAGVIEVVRDARTVYSIQRVTKLGAIQVDSSQLYKWISEKNKGLRLDQAVENFSRSCAGYCVATFVLGIGDRHPDNIMVNTEGIIFHIDFGHFLGNFKKKFGIPRERVPFVLTPDFMLVIARGADNPKESLEFRRFQELCGKAYLALRKHHQLIINLFTLLASAGMPELQSVEDIEYLRTTLAVDMSQEKALTYFHGRFCEAYGSAWTTKLDWFLHSVMHR